VVFEFEVKVKVYSYEWKAQLEKMSKVKVQVEEIGEQRVLLEVNLGLNKDCCVWVRVNLVEEGLLGNVLEMI